MSTKVAAIAPAPDPQFQPATAAAQPAQSEPPATKGQDPAETRLVIEMDKASGSFVYKTINRLTGEIVQQLPRAEVLKLRDGTEYEAGSVVRTNA